RSCRARRREQRGAEPPRRSQRARTKSGGSPATQRTGRSGLEMRRSRLAVVSTKPALPAEQPAPPAEDIRSARPYLLSRRTLLAFLRRLVSITTLAALDVG